MHYHQKDAGTIKTKANIKGRLLQTVLFKNQETLL